MTYPHGANISTWFCVKTQNQTFFLEKNPHYSLVFTYTDNADVFGCGEIEGVIDKN